MSDLLTTEEYKAIARGLTLPTQAFIDGAFRPAISGRTFDGVNPATGAVLAEVAACGVEDVDFAVQKARDAFEDGRWSRLHPAERKAVLIRLAKLIKRNARELAVMESLDSGKTIYDCETVDIPETNSWFYSPDFRRQGFRVWSKYASSAAHLTGTFTLRSGATSTEYFDKYRFEADPFLLRSIAEHLRILIPPETEVLAGLELGGVPIAIFRTLATEGVPCASSAKSIQ